jgi:7-cyano-7-deazaguanine synthase in queuosine biosynthesis
MPERIVFCGGLKAGRNQRDALHIDVSAPVGSRSRVNLHMGDLLRPLADNVPHVLTDMLEIAVYVYCADQFTSRGTSKMTNMGAHWRRKFRFSIPVRTFAFWSKAEIRNALIETLGFLSEDEFDFEFVQATNMTPFQSYLGFSDPSAHTIKPDEVVLFSGGLDSLAGAVDALIGGQKQVALVSHQSSNMIASKQNALVIALRERTDSGSLFYVPVTVNKGQEEATEYTQRTRSLLFATLGLVVARMFGRKKLRFYENGVVSINLPIAEHVLGARASRTTHPRFLWNCSQLFSLLLSEKFTVHNPFVWNTKSEVARKLSDNNCADLITHTLSCTRVREATKLKQHCGVCAQCIDRRFGILAAGIAAYEPSDNYAVDLFTGAHEPGAALTTIESYVVRAQKLAAISQQAFIANYGQIFRAVPYLPGSVDVNVQRIWDLYRRHGQEVITVVNTELQNHATMDRALELPAHSLLAMIVSPVAKQLEYTDPVEAEPTAAAQAAVDTHEYTVAPLAFAIDETARKILFQQGIEFGGSIYGLISALAQEFKANLTEGTFNDEYRFVKASTLAQRLGINEQSLRRRVSRARKMIDQLFLDRCGRKLDLEDVIENKEWQGYRLNPYLLLVNPAQLRAREPSMSQVTSRGVTSRHGTH